MNKLMNFLLWLAFWYTQICRSRIFAHLDVYLYSTNQSENSDGNMIIPNETPNRDELKLWINQTYGTLVMSEKESAPIWKDVDKNLKDIDLYLEAVKNVFDKMRYWTLWEEETGTSGVLTFYNRTSDESQLMYAWDTENEFSLPIPKFVYRIIRGHCRYEHNAYRRMETHDKEYGAIIITHNDPTIGYDDNIGCARCSGWHEIESSYSLYAGLTYVCSLSEVVYEILGTRYRCDFEPYSEPLNLDSVAFPYFWSSEDTSSNGASLIEEGQNQAIHEEYQKLKKYLESYES